METTHFGTLPDGRDVNIYTIRNSRGMAVSATNFGGRITSILTPDREGKLGDVVLGFDTLEEYLADTSYMGAIVGRCANRIAGASFCLDGRQYSVGKNDGEHSNHGGKRGFDQKLWHIEERQAREGTALRLTATSPDGDEGYPGRLDVEVQYILTEGNMLIVRYRALSNKKTVVNLTNHTYFNLSAGRETSVENHLLQVRAGFYLPIAPDFVPAGEFAPVSGTALDFRQPAPVSQALASRDPQVALAKGIDHSFVVSTAKEAAVHCEDPVSGRAVDVFTMEPDVHIYTANFMDGSRRGKGGAAYGRHSALAIEAQHFPDSVHHKNYPSVVLPPGREYFTETRYVFRVAKATESAASKPVGV